ncbi:unnamed protein product, partial [Lepidochelys olivacea]
MAVVCLQTLCTYFCNVNTSSQVPGRSPSLQGAQEPGPSISKISGQSRVDIYCALEKVLQQDTQGLERRLLEKIITLASNHMRETQEATNELKVAASNTLVTLARCYFNDVMCELLYRLELPEEFIFITLGNLSSAYALECIPFVGMILNVMISMLELVKDSRMRQAFCGGLKQAIFKALGPMMSLLLHRKEPKNPIFKEISWLPEQYKEEMDVLHVTKSLSQLLEVSDEYKIPLPKGKFQAICSALHNQFAGQLECLVDRLVKQFDAEQFVDGRSCLWAAELSEGVRGAAGGAKLWSYGAVSVRLCK